MVVRAAVVVCLALTSCVQEDIDAPQELPDLDFHTYRCKVQPVLAARCSFMACHGNADRPFQIYAEQRYRLGIDWIDYETPLTIDELEANFRLVRGFVQPQNLLALKPLDTNVGGRFHRGKDMYGSTDVFVETSDLGYRELVSFALGAVSDPNCRPVEEVGL